MLSLHRGVCYFSKTQHGIAVLVLLLRVGVQGDPDVSGERQLPVCKARPVHDIQTVERVNDSFARVTNPPPPWINNGNDRWSGIKLLRLTCIIAFTTTWMAFILSSVVIVGAVVWSDTCQWLKLAAAVGWETAGLDGQSARVLNGCFRGQPVADNFNFTDTLGFFDSYIVTAEEVSGQKYLMCAFDWTGSTEVHKEQRKRLKRGTRIPMAP